MKIDPRDLVERALSTLWQTFVPLGAAVIATDISGVQSIHNIAGLEKWGGAVGVSLAAAALSAAKTTYKTLRAAGDLPTDMGTGGLDPSDIVSDLSAAAASVLDPSKSGSAETSVPVSPPTGIPVPVVPVEAQP